MKHFIINYNTHKKYLRSTGNKRDCDNKVIVSTSTAELKCPLRRGGGMKEIMILSMEGIQGLKIWLN